MNTNSVIGKSFILILGSGISQLVPVLFLPILGHFYTQSSFANFSLFMSFGAIISIVSTGRYELALMQIKDEKNAIELMFLIFLLALAISIFSSFILLIVYYFCQGDLWGIKLDLVFILYLPFSILSFSLMQAFSYWFLRTGRYFMMSSFRVIQSLIVVITGVFFGVLGFEEKGLIYSFALGGGGMGLVMVYFGYKQRNYFSINNLILQAKQYKHFLKHLMPTALMDTLAVQSPIFFLSSYFDSFLVGSYAFANRIVIAPVSLLSTSIGQIYFQQISLHGITKKEIKRRFRITFNILLVLSFSLFLFLFLYADKIIDFIFDQKWSYSGKVLSILSLSLIARFIVSPLSLTLVAMNKLSLVSMWQTGYLVSTVLFFLFCSTIGFEKALYLYAIHESVQYLIYFILIYKTINSKSISS